MCAQPGPTSTPTLRSIDTTAPSSNPYRPPAGSSMTPPPLQPAPPRAPPHLGRPIAPACCCPRLSLSLSKHRPHTHSAVAYARVAFLPAVTWPVPDPCTASSTTSPDTIGQRHQPRRRRPPPSPAQPPQAHARPALDAAAHLPWPLLHPTLSTGQLPTSLASLSRRPTPQPPNSGRWLWTSPA
jgi:hypothetical protein